MHPIAPGVWQLAGWPRDFFNIYLIDDVLIDAGTRWARKRIIRQLAGRTIRSVVLTHCHPDHQGSAHAICTQFGVPLACHEADVAATEGRAPMVARPRLERLTQFMWAGPPHPVGRVLRDGDEIAGFRVVHTPGHTPGHICLFRESDRLAIAGDLLANIHFVTRQPGLREPPRVFSTDAAQNRRSIQTLIDLKPALVCFGHGPPLRESAQLDHFRAPPLP